MTCSFRHVSLFAGMALACIVLAFSAGESVVADAEECRVDGVLVEQPAPDVICDGATTGASGDDAASADDPAGEGAGSSGGDTPATESGSGGDQPVQSDGGTTDASDTGGDQTQDDSDSSKPIADDHPRRHHSPTPHRRQPHRQSSARGRGTQRIHHAPRLIRRFRGHVSTHGRIPDIRHMRTRQMRALTRGASAGHASWSTVAALAWLDSRWGRAGDGSGFVGSRLRERDWRRFGTDGSGDGIVDRESASDECATVASLLSHHGKRGLQYYLRRPALARRARYLAAYYDALGQHALTAGLVASGVRSELGKRVLANRRLEIYADGREDIEAGRIDPRVLVLLQFLGHRYGSITVSSLESGHGVFTSSGNISLHSYGQAVDISAINGQPVLGHQAHASSFTVRVLTDVLRMPRSMQPHELISLWTLGGPSFSMADHHDHIHVGFATLPD